MPTNWKLGLAVGQFVNLWASALLLIFANANVAVAQSMSGTVSVIDGNHFKMQGSNLTVQLYGIETCAMDDVAHFKDIAWRCGVVSAGWLTQLTLGYEVKCIDEGSAGYAAVFGRCFLPSGEDISKMALKLGMAFAARQDGIAIEEAYGAIEDEARRLKSGIWSSNFVHDGVLYRAGAVE